MHTPAEACEPDGEEDVAFFAAVRNGDDDTARRLAEAAPGEIGHTRSLQWAAWRGDAEGVRRHLPWGNPKAQDSLALVWAASQGHAEVVALLIPVSDPVAESTRALCLAASKGFLDVVDLLRPFAQSLNRCGDALGWATRHGQKDAVRRLLGDEPDFKTLRTEWNNLVSEQNWAGVDTLGGCVPLFWAQRLVRRTGRTPDRPIPPQNALPLTRARLLASQLQDSVGQQAGAEVERPIRPRM